MMRFCCKTENSSDLLNLVSKCSTRSNLENEYPHFMFLSTNTLVIGILSDHAMAHTSTIRHCKLASPRVNEPYTHLRRACDSRNYRRVIVEISTCWPMEVLHRNSM